MSAEPVAKTKQDDLASMDGEVCIVTGANTGIGKAAALGLARLGATVVTVCRDAARGEAARQEIIAASGHSHIDLLIADLASQASIRRCVEEFKRRYDRLDVLVNNAGVNLSERSVTPEGIETTFAVNHLASFLLTTLLLDSLKASAPARVVVVSSDALSDVEFDNLQGERKYDPMRMYSQSKMMNLLFTYELARRLTGTGVTVNAVHPGVVRTELGRDVRGAFKLLLRIVTPFFASPEKGADTILYLASSPDVEGISGGYFTKRKPVNNAPGSTDLDAARRLWDISTDLTQVEARL